MKAMLVGLVVVFISALLTASCLESNPQPAPSTTGTVDEGEGGPPNKGGGGGDEEDPIQAAADVNVDSGLPASLDNGAADCSGEYGLDLVAEIGGWCDAAEPADWWETTAGDMGEVQDDDQIDAEETTAQNDAADLSPEQMD